MADSIENNDQLLRTNNSQPDVPNRPTRFQRIRQLALKNFLPLGLVFLVGFGILVPAPGVFLSEFPTHYICIVGIFLHSGLKLRTGEIRDTIRAYKALIYQILVIMLLTPIIGVKLTELLPFGREALLSSRSSSTNDGINRTSKMGMNESGRTSQKNAVLGPAEFKTGIELYLIVPCTISAGVVLVSQAGGNATLALVTTIVCNLMAVFTLPVTMKWLMSFEGVKLDAINLLVKLLLTVLLPLVVGKGLRYIPKVKSFVKRFTNCLKLLSVALLIMIPWMKVSNSSDQGAFNSLYIPSVFAILTWGVGLHVVFMGFNLVVSLVLKFDPPTCKCIVILASQKSLVVMVTVLSLLPFSSAAQGLMALPAIIIHLGVLVLDAFVVTWWHNRDERRKKEQNDIVLETLEQKEEPLDQQAVLYESHL
ncbi:probable sodium/metabolite cotransporter BASS4, chloroplastic [Nematostella vectensis]|uniref:probable sodium/metabolite cotransporter BASS4, chloroplastic n=1 Tax=Nematostella vectensis TaxID=45351 RepID=UPI002076DBA8|nr:probable sodium/metabolite cotransporter BASS4, chloroplastic [Nematostella vectensis]